MPMPPLDSGAGAILRDLIYINARIKADKKTKHLSPTVAPHAKAVAKSMQERNDADTAAIEAGALTEAAWVELREAVLVLGIKAFGHFVKRTHPGFVRLYPKAPSDLVGLKVDERADAIGLLVKAAEAKATPKELAEPVAALVAAHGAWTAAVQAETGAVTELGAKGKAVKAAVDAGLTATRKLKGQLTDLFPRDARRVQSYFPVRGGKSKKPDPANPAPEPK